MKLIPYKMQTESYDHLVIYISVVEAYLKTNGITDYSKFEMALSHDNPHFMKWEYDKIVKPTEEYMNKEFLIFNVIQPRKRQQLDLEYIYIWATSIAHNLKEAKLITNENEPIYFNIEGVVIFPNVGLKPGRPKDDKGEYDKNKTS